MKRLLIAVSMVVMVSAFTSSIKAFGMDEYNWPTQTTLDESCKVGNLMLAPGTYNFYRAPTFLATDLIMVYSVDNARWEGIVRGVYALRSDTPYGSGLTFVRTSKDMPERLEYWFYSNWDWGIKIVYPENRSTGTMSALNARTVK
jgi:hypothetical protein